MLAFLGSYTIRYPCPRAPTGKQDKSGIHRNWLGVPLARLGTPVTERIGQRPVFQDDHRLIVSFGEYGLNAAHHFDGTSATASISRTAQARQRRHRIVHNPKDLSKCNRVRSFKRAYPPAFPRRL